MPDELPNTLVKSSTRTLQSAGAAPKSPFSFSSQAQDWGGRQWLFDIEFTSQKGAGARALAAFFHKNGGRAGSFIFRCPTMRREYTNTPLVKGAGQTGESLVTDGWSSNELKAGDFISIGTRLHTVMADVTHTAGTATISIYPPLRSSPADNTPVEIVAPSVLLRALEDVPVPIDTALFHHFTIKCEEVL
jgi:hypothetical protein